MSEIAKRHLALTNVSAAAGVLLQCIVLCPKPAEQRNTVTGVEERAGHFISVNCLSDAF